MSASITILVFYSAFILSCPFDFSVRGVQSDPTNGAPPTIRHDASPNILVNEGSRGVRLSCPVRSESPLFFDWRKGSQTIGPGWMNYRVLGNGDLRIKLISPTDQGVFVCRAANGFGSVEFEYYLDVNGTENDPATTATTGGRRRLSQGLGSHDSDPIVVIDIGGGTAPVWRNPVETLYNGRPPGAGSVGSGPIHKLVGDNVRFKCAADGSPSPSVAWFKDGRSLPKSSPSVPWSLELGNLQESDSGLYSCVVSNAFGNKTAKFPLKVRARAASGKVADSISPPLSTDEFFYQYPTNMTFVEGDTVRLFCTVKSKLQPHIQWLRRIDRPSQAAPNASLLTVHGRNYSILSRDQSRVIRHPNGSFGNHLSIQRAETRHTGWYLCVVTTPPGRIIHRDAYLEVVRLSPYQLPLYLAVGAPIAVVGALVLGYIIWCCKRQASRNMTKKPPQPCSGPGSVNSNSTNPNNRTPPKLQGTSGALLSRTDGVGPHANHGPPLTSHQLLPPYFTGGPADSSRRPYAPAWYDPLGRAPYQSGTLMGPGLQAPTPEKYSCSTTSQNHTNSTSLYHQLLVADQQSRPLLNCNNNDNSNNHVKNNNVNNGAPPSVHAPSSAYYHHLSTTVPNVRPPNSPYVNTSSNTFAANGRIPASAPFAGYTTPVSSTSGSEYVPEGMDGCLTGKPHVNAGGALMNSPASPSPGNYPIYNCG